jgi:hypothetical protein
VQGALLHKAKCLKHHDGKGKEEREQRENRERDSLATVDVVVVCKKK